MQTPGAAGELAGLTASATPASTTDAFAALRVYSRGGTSAERVGVAVCFPTTADAVIESVPLPDSAVAAGANSALREVGGVFGAAVFAAHGSYATPASFIAGFQPAMMVVAVVPLAGVLAAVVAPSKSAGSSAPASGGQPRQLQL